MKWINIYETKHPSQCAVCDQTTGIFVISLVDKETEADDSIYLCADCFDLLDDSIGNFKGEFSD